MSSAQTNAALARSIYQLFSENRFDEVLALTTEDVEVMCIPFDRAFHGREGLRIFMQELKSTFPDMCITTIIHQVATDDEVVNEFKARGAHMGLLITPAGAVPPTGRTVELMVCAVCSIRDGKLASLRNYQDVASILRQLGVVA
ncbi:MAG: ester cyclase [Chloroflexi bacterium]|nr:ester cyclase [Chloroflexota bacterium]